MRVLRLITLSVTALVSILIVVLLRDLGARPDVMTIPVVIALVPFFRSKQTALVLSALAMSLWIFLGLFSVGWFYIPSAALLWIQVLKAEPPTAGGHTTIRHPQEQRFSIRR